MVRCRYFCPPQVGHWPQTLHGPQTQSCTQMNRCSGWCNFLIPGYLFRVVSWLCCNSLAEACKSYIGKPSQNSRFFLCVLASMCRAVLRITLDFGHPQVGYLVISGYLCGASIQSRFLLFLEGGLISFNWALFGEGKKQLRLNQRTARGLRRWANMSLDNQKNHLAVKAQNNESSLSKTPCGLFFRRKITLIIWPSTVHQLVSAKHHPEVSSNVSTQGMPPPIAACFTVRTRLRCPPPQVTVQWDQSW